MPLNFYGDEAPTAFAEGGGPSASGAEEATPFFFGQPIGYFPVDLHESGSLVGAFLETFRTEPDLTDHDRGLLIDGMEVLDAQMNAVKDAGAVYFAYGMHPDPKLGFAESYLAVYVRNVGIGNPRAVLAGFAEAAVGQGGIKAVSRREFSGGPAVLAEYERVLVAVGSERVPSNERVALHQLQAAFSFPKGDKLAVLELTSRHTHLWDSYRDILHAVADTVSFEASREGEARDGEGDGHGGHGGHGHGVGADGADAGTSTGAATGPATSENLHTRMTRLLG